MQKLSKLWSYGAIVGHRIHEHRSWRGSAALPEAQCRMTVKVFSSSDTFDRSGGKDAWIISKMLKYMMNLCFRRSEGRAEPGDY